MCFYDDMSGLERALDSIVLNLPMKYCKVITVDGIFYGYQGKEPLSTDGSRELIKTYQDKYGEDVIQLHDRPNLRERHKRQSYIDIASQQGFKFVLINDSDEWIDCKDRPALLEELKLIDKEFYVRQTFIDKKDPDVRPVANVHNIRCVDRDNSGYIFWAGLRARLWYRPEEMTYTTRHFYWKRKDLVIGDIQRDATDTDDDIARKQFMNTIITSANLGHESFTIQNLQLWHSHDLRTPDRELKMSTYEKRKN